jgi:hypothetical protein
MNTKSLMAAVVVFGGLMGPCADAATVPYKNLAQLVGESAVIMIGTATGIAYETNEKDGHVYTRVRLQQLKALKGEQHVKARLAQGMTLAFWGGLRKDGTISDIVGMPRLQVAHTYVVFLRGGQWTLNPITGWHQGIFQAVGTGTKGGQILVTVTGEVVMGVHNDRLLVAPLPGPAVTPKAESTLKVELGQSKQELEQITRDLKDSIYREDRLDQLEAADEDGEREAKRKAPAPRRLDKQQRLEHTLGGRPMYLDEFVSVIQALDRRVQKDYGLAFRLFQADPTPLPKTRKELSPPR